MEEYLKTINAKIKEIIPGKIDVEKVAVEGPEITIYVKDQKPFFDDETIVSKLAFELKKRVNIRTAKNQLMEEKKAEPLIRKIIPEDAQIETIYFEPAFSEVVIEALKPGVVIGKNGMTLKEIIEKTGWTPRILRLPARPSKILQGMRYFLAQHSNERKKFLEEVSKKIYRKIEEPNKWVRVSALGAFREVGRSCLFIETPETKILIDVGLGVDYNRQDPLPYLEVLRFPLAELDAVILSHAHMDHCGMIPYLFKMGYEGPVYCTEPTRDLMALLTFDYIKLLRKEGKEPLYDEQDVKKAILHCIIRDYEEVTDVAPDIKLTYLNAAHILGSAMVHLHFGEGNHNLLYSADIKFGFTRLFNQIPTKFPRLETLIIESTYADQNDIMPPRRDAEEKLVKVINETIAGGGNVLIPVFSVGRAQEAMLTLEEHYRNGNLNPEAKIWVDGMIKEASAIHTVYPEYLRANVQKRVLQNDNPFISDLFQDVEEKEERNRLKEGNGGGNIILTTSGMMNGGPVLEYFYKMAEDPKNTLVFIGYQSEGSLGKRLQTGTKEIVIQENGKMKKIDVKMKVETVEGFSGHSDRNQLLAFISNLQPLPKRIIVNHGEKTKAIEFAKYLGSRFKVNASAPQNLDAIRLK